jgi:hypothetical protein
MAIADSRLPATPYGRAGYNVGNHSSTTLSGNANRTGAKGISETSTPSLTGPASTVLAWRS